MVELLDSLQNSLCLSCSSRRWSLVFRHQSVSLVNLHFRTLLSDCRQQVVRKSNQRWYIHVLGAVFVGVAEFAQQYVDLRFIELLPIQRDQHTADELATKRERAAEKVLKEPTDDREFDRPLPDPAKG